MFDSDFVSPISSLKRILPENSDVILDLKRDDLIHPFISGNKWRKLKYIIEDAKKTGKKALVTFGGAWSNHLLATACAGAVFNFKTFGIVRGEEEIQNPILSLCKLYGMEIFQVSRSTYRDKNQAREDFFNSYKNKTDALLQDDFYTIPEGGAHPLALKGCSEIIDELPHKYDHIFCACGTATTLSGLIIGVQNNHLETHTQLHGIPVLSGVDYLKEEIENRVPNAQYNWHPQYHFGGYAKTTEELMNFIQSFSSRTGILIEPIYTGKMMYGVLDLIKNAYFKPESKILLLHTGGLTGLLGKNV